MATLPWALAGEPGEWKVRAVRNPEPEIDVAQLDEAALIDACFERRAGAFDAIVERHGRAVYRLCYRFVGNHEDASDLSQDVFVRAFRGLSGFRRGSSLSTWLHRIAVNTCLNRVSQKTPGTEPIDTRQHVDT